MVQPSPHPATSPPPAPVQVQVRGRLVEEVKRQGLLQGSAQPPEERSLQQRATDCLVLEHLQGEEEV